MGKAMANARECMTAGEATLEGKDMAQGSQGSVFSNHIRGRRAPEPKTWYTLTSRDLGWRRWLQISCEFGEKYRASWKLVKLQKELRCPLVNLNVYPGLRLSKIYDLIGNIPGVLRMRGQGNRC